MISIKELKIARSDLWLKLDAILEKQEPYKIEERAIRQQIRDIQNQLYALEMPNGPRKSSVFEKISSTVAFDI